MKKELSDQEELDVVELKKSGMKTAQIAREYWVSWRTIHRTLKKHGVPNASVHGRPKLIIDAYYAGMTPKKISIAYGVSLKYVHSLIWGTVAKKYKRYHDEAKSNSDR